MLATARTIRRELEKDRLQQAANHLGLFSEEYDPDGRRQLGNFPQAFTHLGCLEAVCAVQEAKGAGRGRFETAVS